VEADPSMSLRAIAEAMATQNGKRLSLMAWSRALKSLGISKVTAKKTIITEEKPAASKATHYRAVHRREPEPGRYPSSLTELEWEALKPLVERKGGQGCPASHERRVMWDAVFYQVRSGGACSRQNSHPIRLSSGSLPGPEMLVCSKRYTNACTCFGGNGHSGSGAKPQKPGPDSKVRRHAGKSYLPGIKAFPRVTTAA
jgi:hypothetical protein